MVKCGFLESIEVVSLGLLLNYFYTTDMFFHYYKECCHPCKLAIPVSQKEHLKENNFT